MALPTAEGPSASPPTAFTCTLLPEPTLLAFADLGADAAVGGVTAAAPGVKLLWESLAAATSVTASPRNNLAGEAVAAAASACSSGVRAG
jgi:uncharacterized membrane protein